MSWGAGSPAHRDPRSIGLPVFTLVALRNVQTGGGHEAQAEPEHDPARPDADAVPVG